MFQLYLVPLVDCVLVEYERYAIGLLLGELILRHHKHNTCVYKSPVEKKQFC